MNGDDALNIYIIKLNSLIGELLMSKVEARKRKDGQWEVVGGGNTVITMGRDGAEDIAAKRNMRFKKKN